MNEQEQRSIVWRVLYYLVSVVACLVLIGAAALALRWIYSSEPTAEREGATRKTAALVETLVVSRGTYEPELSVLGNVQPAREISLNPLVGGQVITVDPAFELGGIIDAGQTLLTIDPADYKNNVTLRRSELKQAEAELVIERGQQAVARKELEALGREVSPENRALVLREPQIESIQARIDSAKAALQQAELDLKRTAIAAPFHAQILRRSANLGSRVSAGDPVARLVGVDAYWVIASVPLRHLGHLQFADTDQKGSIVRVRLNSVWAPGVTRTGEVTRLIGELDPQARLAQVLITINDPLSLKSDGPPLLIDTIVEAKITGRPLEGVVRLPRDYLRQNDTVWVFEEGKLAIREVEVAFGNASDVYISKGLTDGDEIVTTSLSTVSEGRPLRRVGDNPPDDSTTEGDE